MKKLKCDIKLCEFVAEGGTFEQWMKNLMPHYMEAHKDIMSDLNKTKEDQTKWMEVNKVRFDNEATE